MNQALSIIFLLTRTFLDFYILSKYSKYKIPKNIFKIGKKMCGITNLLFRRDGSIPHFGDNSPDMPIQWLVGLNLIMKEQNILEKDIRCNLSGYAGGLTYKNKIKNIETIKLNKIKLAKKDWHSKFFKKRDYFFLLKKILI